MNILGVIPARGGSKGIPRKNLTSLAGRPLIAYTFEAALTASSLSRVIITTDDPEIADFARQSGVEVPFIRPADLAADDTPALPVIQHAVHHLDEQENWRADVVVYLQPTSPLRRAQHIQEAVSLLLENEADSVVSVMEVPHHFNPLSVMKMDEGRLVSFYKQEGSVGPLRRQDKPRVFARNGPAILATRRAVLMEQGTLYGARTLPYLMDAVDSVDIDTPFDLEWAAFLLSRRNS
jgi:CMP-N,N'-diacetyllegionaminic acid synthase